jgi:lambda family phage tail tape measure protein
MASLTYAVDVQTSGAVSSLASLQKQITGIGTAAVAAGAVAAGAFALKGIINTTRELEELRGAFTTVTGDAARSAAEFDRVRQLSNALGTDARALGETYVKLANSGISPTNALLTSLVDVSKNSTDQFGALTAAADLFSRTVSGGLGLEDLNRLQDRGIPVFKMLQEQLGLSRLEIAKFGKTAEGAEKIRQALYKGFQEQFGGTSIRELSSINSQLMVLKNTTDQMKESFGTGLTQAIGAGVGTVGELSSKMNDLAKAMGQALGGALVFIINNLNILIPLVSGLAAAWAAVKFYELAKGVMAMVTAFRALTVAMIANPIGLVVAGVAALVAGFVILVQKTGSVSNAFKTLGNAGIAIVNTLVNAWSSFGQFIGHLMVGVGKAILAGLNPFSNKSAMGELQSGFKKGIGAVQRQMSSGGPIKFKFQLDPVSKGAATPKIDTLAGGYTGPTMTGAGAGGGGGGEASKKAVEDSKKIAEQMREQAAAAQQVTKELVAQNAASNEMRQLEIDLIGFASEYANFTKANAQARKQAAEEIRGLEAKIVEEQAKGKEANAGVIEELRKQIEEKNKQLGVTLQLNEAENKRTLEIAKQNNLLEYQRNFIREGVTASVDGFREQFKLELLSGKISQERFDNMMKTASLAESHAATLLDLERQMEDAVARQDAARQDSLRLQIATEKNRHTQAMNNLAKEIDFTQNMRNSTKAGVRAAIENAKKITEPFYVAEQATASFFSNMNSALDNFVETGKFKFGSFAKSVIADLAKIALKAAATKLFTMIGKSILGGLAAGGPAMANKPYLVGEQGPELFVPNSAGSIMTNASLNRNAGPGEGMQPVVNNTYITNNISAIDSRSVAQMFVENRKSLLGASMMARKEMPYGG